MPSLSLEERMDILEADVERIKHRLPGEEPTVNGSWVDQVFGAFADSVEFDEAVKAGREYRESLRPQPDEEAA